MPLVIISRPTEPTTRAMRCRGGDGVSSEVGATPSSGGSEATPGSDVSTAGS